MELDQNVSGTEIPTTEYDNKTNAQTFQRDEGIIGQTNIALIH